MIQRTTKSSLTLQLREMKRQVRIALRKGHYAKYRYARNWLKAHAALLKEIAR
jgi:hypothetical protein